MENIISIQNISKTFGNNVVLRDISLNVNKGEVITIIGSSGSGKSTLLNAIFPNLKLQTGELSQRIERGKNTTRHTELFSFDEIIGSEYQGYLADTPGFSLLDFERFDFFCETWYERWLAP